MQYEKGELMIRNISKKIFFMSLVLAITCVLSTYTVQVQAKSKTAAFYVTKGAKGTFYGKNRTIALKGRPGIWTGNADSPDHARFNVYLDDNLVATKDVDYNSAGEICTFKYQVAEYGEYKITFSHLAWNSGFSTYYEENIKEATLIVVNPSKAKKIVPAFTATNEYDGSTWYHQIQIAGMDSNATTTIFRATSKNGKYKQVKKISKATFVDYLEETNKTYYYKIQVTITSGNKSYTTKKSKTISVKLTGE